MGVVYVVEHIHTGEHLALKLLHGAAAADPSAIARFKREARAGAQIKSEFVVRVTDADIAPELGGAPFFVMDLLEGLDLEKLVTKLGPLHSEVVTQLLGQIARALEKAHRIGIVHRDLKPENIFLQCRDDDAPIAKILDFGISKFLRSDDLQGGSLGLTHAGSMMGTPFYMSPEQARGDVDAIDATTDIWATGIVAIRLLTGQSYWTATTHADLTVQLLAAPMERPSSRWPWLGAKFDDWFARSCHRDRSQRWTGASEQIGALVDALRGVQSPGAGMASIVEVLRKAPSDRPRKLVDPTGSGPHEQRAALPERTLTANVPPVMPCDLQGYKAVGGTTAGSNLTRTARELGIRRGSRALIAASGLGLIASLWMVYRLFSPAPLVPGETMATGTPSGGPSSVVPIAPGGGASGTGNGQKDLAKVEAIEDASPLETATPTPTASASPSGRPPAKIAPKPRSRPTRPVDPAPSQSDDLMRP
jgi:serine/threonine-protein kinase